MLRNLFLLFFCITISLLLKAQMLPKERSNINYRLVGFSFPAGKQVTSYRLEIAKGEYNSEDSFSKKIIITKDSKKNKIIAEVPSFGNEYSWRIIYKDRKVKAGSINHFTVKILPGADTTKLRLRIMQPAMEYQDGFVSVDASGVLYDMGGQPVWCVSDSNIINDYIKDLSFTPEGSITLISKNAYEINYNSEILWAAPNTGKISGNASRGEFYHHEFKRINNGHYMVLGTQSLDCKFTSSNDSSLITISGNASSNRNMPQGCKKGRFGILIEYDKKGNVVWSWKSADYLKTSDYKYFNPADSNARFDPHENAFYFDEKKKVIYLCYRNLNRVIKIDYPSGRVLRSYGEIFKPGIRDTGAGLFCNPHNINISQDGYLYFFNNNSCQLADSLPTVFFLKEPTSINDSFKKVWEYTCPVEDGAIKKFPSGGNVIELPDHSVFINMGSEYSKLMIVNRDKKVLWSALPEKYLETEKKWAPVNEYRANIISRKNVENLIWKAEGTASGQIGHKIPK